MSISLRTLLFVSLFTLGMAPMVLHMAMQAPGVYEMLQESAHRDALSRAESEMSAVSARVNQRIDTVRTLSILPVYPELTGRGKREDVHRLNREVALKRFAQVMTRWFEPHDDVIEISVTGLDGQERANLLRDAGNRFRPADTEDLRDRSGDDCFLEAIDANGKVAVVTADISGGIDCVSVTPQPTLFLSKQLYTGKGQAIGVIIVNFNLRKLLTAGSANHWVLTDGSYLSGVRRVTDASAFTDFPGLRDLVEAGEYPEVITLNGGHTVVWQPFVFGGRPDSAVWIGSPVDRSSMTRWLEHIARHIFIWTGLMLVVVSILAHFFSRAIDNVRHQVIEGVHRIVSNTGDVHFNWRYTRELRELGKELEELADQHFKLAEARRDVQEQLKRERDQVTALNETLEQKVEERTGQLHIANLNLEAFNYSVSHDLRAPLRAIDGFSRVLQEDYEDRLDDQGRDMLRRIALNTERMRDLIEDLLSLSFGSRKELEKEPVNLGQTALEILDELKAQNIEREIEIEIADVPGVEADAKLMRIVLENLIGNAWKYTRDRKPAKIEFGSRQLQDEVEFYLRDNGVGFDMKDVDRLFDPFERVHDKKDFEGSGIGLATVKRILDRHAGRVRAEAVPGLGATFFFTLPL